MPSRIVLTLSAITLAVLGGATLFAPLELVRAVDPNASASAGALVQVAGSGLIAFAILDWMSRRNRMGGIYARPLAVANLLLFSSAAISLGKAASAGLFPMSSLALCALMGGLAVAFGWLVFAHDPVD